MNKSYKHNVEWKDPDMMLFDSIYRKFKNKQNESTVLEVRKVIVLGEEVGSSEAGFGLLVIFD